MTAPESSRNGNGSAWRAIAIALIVSIGTSQAGFNGFLVLQIMALQKECRP